MDEFRHFVMAQQDVYQQVVEELRAGHKRTHWMWFIFPQLAGLGQNEMSGRFALSSLAEAMAYLHHALLGPRLRECTALVNVVEGRSIHDVFGSPDDMKFRSSMTLFARSEPDNAEFLAALAHYFDAEEDRRTLELLGIDDGR